MTRLQRKLDGGRRVEARESDEAAASRWK